MYKGIARSKDGRIFEATGTIQDLSNWADNLIRVVGSCDISIQMIGEDDGSA